MRPLTDSGTALPVLPVLPALQVLPVELWRDLEAAHHSTVDQLLTAHRDRVGRGRTHPVEDFLFTYYAHRPARLRRWHPGVGVALTLEPQDHDRLHWRHYGDTGSGATLDLTSFMAHRGAAVRGVRNLLVAIESRPVQLGCFGLHEWAMVYRSSPEEVRHAGWPLRLGARGTDAVVERHRLRCTHHDAFRFFSPAARPLNALQPSRQEQVSNDQPGCLHVTMDLYKWAYQLSPAVPSALQLQCFQLARDVRELDMRASPYDLRGLGYEPVAIETSEGKACYVEAQRSFAERAAPLRDRLVQICNFLLATLTEPMTSRRNEYETEPDDAAATAVAGPGGIRHPV